jgi:hypothetical protein
VPLYCAFSLHFGVSFVTGQIMSNPVIHVKSCHSCQIMSLMSNHVVHVKSCHSCCHSCHPLCHSCLLVIKYVIIGILYKVGLKVLLRPLALLSAKGKQKKGLFSYLVRSSRFKAETSYSQLYEVSPTQPSNANKFRTLLVDCEFAAAQIK